MGVRTNNWPELGKRKLGKKGVTGKVITTIIALVIAIVALILLWMFLSQTMPLLTKGVDKLISGFKKMLCDKLAFLKWPIIKNWSGC